MRLEGRTALVTGGASAGWGSDAVAGVVNFVLDKDFTGLKGQAQGGVTTYGDDPNFNVSLTAGTGFAVKEKTIEVAPAGTTTEEVPPHAPVDAKVTFIPPVGAALASLTVPFTAAPPTTSFWLIVKPETFGAVTVRLARNSEISRALRRTGRIG